MTRRESFNAAEWTLLGDAPLAAGAAVALASPGGGRSEAEAVGLFGVAAQSMSLDERAMMSTIARALGYGKP